MMGNVFDCANSVRDRTMVCTQEEFERIIDSSIVKALCEQISFTPFPVPKGEGSTEYREWKDAIAPLKKQLPILCPHAHFTDEWRHRESAVQSPWMSMDFDGIANPQEFWKQKLEPHVERLRIVLAFISPSGKGIKVISQRPSPPPPTLGFAASLVRAEEGGEEGIALMDLAEAQAWFANEVGIDDYDHTHDLARAVYLVPRSYLLHYCPSLLFAKEVQPFEVKSEKQKVKNPDYSSDGGTSLPLPEGGGGKGGEAPLFGPIPYSDIVTAYFEKKLGHQPRVGERHAALVSWVNAAFGLICDNDKELMLRVTPRLGKPEQEVVDIVNNVAQYHERRFSPYESKLLKSVIAELIAKNEAENKTADDDLLDELNQEEMPPLPPPIQAMVNISPKGFKIPMIVIATIMFGELLCRFRAKLNAWETEFPGFFYVFEAQAGGGKRFINIAKELILKVAEENDRVQTDIYKNWASEKDRHSTDAKYVAPPEPKPVFMMGPNKFSPSELIKEAMNNQGVGIITISEEIDTHTNSNKGGPLRDTSDLERIGWDGGSMTQRYAGPGTVYGTADIFLSLIFTGTPKAVDRAFPDAENGLVTRYIYDTVDNRFIGAPDFKPISDKNRNMIRKYAEKALRTCFDEEGNIMPIQMMKMDWALPAIKKWADEYLALAQMTRNVALDAFRRRPPKMALRAMMVVNWLWGCKKARREDVIKFGLWFADHAIDSEMRRFGNSYEEQMKVVDKTKERSVKQCKYDVLYSLLPNVFTTEDVDEKQKIAGLYCPPRQSVYVLKNNKQIEKINSKTYRKLL